MPSTQDDFTNLSHLNLAHVAGGVDTAPPKDRQEQPPLPTRRPCNSAPPSGEPGELPQCYTVTPGGMRLFPR